MTSPEASGHAHIGRRRSKTITFVVAIPLLVALGAGAFVLGRVVQGEGTAQLAASEAAAPPQAAPAQAPEAEEPDPEPSLNWASVVAFNEAEAAQDMEALQTLVSPGSPAEAWLGVYTNIAAADRMGEPLEPADPGATTYDEAAGTVTTTDSDGTQTIIKDWATDDEGRIVSWSDARGTPIAERLFGAGGSGSGAGQTATITGGLMSISGALFVTVDLTAPDGGVIDWSTASYVDPSGIRWMMDFFNGPDEIAPGSTAKVYFGFVGAEPGGTLYYDAFSTDYEEHAVLTLPLQGLDA